MLPELLLVFVDLLVVLLEDAVDDEQGEEQRPLGLDPGKLLRGSNQLASLSVSS